jgi:hypothetical protein
MADFACPNPPRRIFVNIGALIPYDTSKCSQHHYLHLRAKIDGNGSILMELWSSEVRVYDGEIRCQNSLSRIFINIGLFFTYYA